MYRESDFYTCQGCGGTLRNGLGHVAFTVQTDAGECRVHDYECAARWLSARYSELLTRAEKAEECLAKMTVAYEGEVISHRVARGHVARMEAECDAVLAKPVPSKSGVELKGLMAERLLALRIRAAGKGSIE